jgi:hypothetical protein
MEQHRGLQAADDRRSSDQRYVKPGERLSDRLLNSAYRIPAELGPPRLEGRPRLVALDIGVDIVGPRVVDLLGRIVIATAFAAAWQVHSAAMAGSPWGPAVGQYTPDGQVDLRDTSYFIPAGAYFVAPGGTRPGAGTERSPWDSIARAVAAAPSGSTIVIRRGVYREGGIKLAGKKLTLQPYPHEKVWLKGSLVVSNWVADGPRWCSRGWTRRFPPDVPKEAEAIDPAYPMAAHRDMVFLDGKPLHQVDRLTRVSRGTFYVDYAGSRLYIGDDPRGRTVEAAAFPYAIDVVAADGTTVRGLGFMHYATGYGPGQKAALRTDSASATIEDNTFAWNATVGLVLYGPDAVVRGNTAAFNGEEGIGGYTADGLLLERNAIAYNNQEHFNTSWEGGGVKFAKSRHMLWRDNLGEANIGAAFWCDISCYDTTIVRNVCRKNTAGGIHYEISARAIIASNLVVENGKTGILIGAGSEDVRVYNNTLSRNQKNIGVADDGRTSTEDPRITWDTRNVTIKNNILSNGAADSTEMLQVVDFSPIPKTAAQMHIIVDSNGYYRASSSVASTLIRWFAAPGQLPYRTLDAFRSSTGQEAHGLLIQDEAVNPFFIDESHGDYRLKPGSPGLGRGEPLPADIAAALGVAAGEPVDLGTLEEGEVQEGLGPSPRRVK